LGKRRRSGARRGYGNGLLRTAERVSHGKSGLTGRNIERHLRIDLEPNGSHDGKRLAIDLKRWRRAYADKTDAKDRKETSGRDLVGVTGAMSWSA
jgi:hypothetical protein